MEYTKAQLIADMDALGYPVTSRRLTDWIQKGLLPALTQRGRGRERGTKFFWSQPGVLNQAVDLFLLLEWHNKVQRIRLPLWFLGHDQALPEIRRRLVEQFDDVVELIESGGPTGHLDDLISDAVWAHVGRSSAKRKMPSVNMVAAFDLFLRTLTDPQFVISEITIKNLVSAFDPSGRTIPPAVAGKTTAEWWQFGQDHFAFSRQRDAFAGISDEELIKAHDDLRLISGVVRLLSRTLMDIEDEGMLRVLVHLNSFACKVDVVLRYAGHGDWIDERLKELINFSQRVLVDDDLRTRIRKDSMIDP